MSRQTTRQVLAEARRRYPDRLPIRAEADGSVTMAAPAGEPRRYEARRNVGGRRFVGWVGDLARDWQVTP